jgi:simple sugar transport system permease protein
MLSARADVRDVATLIGGAGVAALLTLGVVLAIGGYDAPSAVAALFRGAFGSWYNFTSGTLVRAVPLAMAGLAVIVAFRAGVMNIGVEGQLLAGAACATTVALATGSAGIGLLLALVAGASGGLLWSAIPAWMRVRFGVFEVISTLMLNAIAVHAVSWLVRGPLQEPTRTYPQSSLIADAARLPLLPSAGRLHAGFLLAVVLIIAAALAASRTATGFNIRVIGANAFAARSAGRINVTRLSTFAFLASGALAGLAGAIEVQGVTYALYENLSPGYGYSAIAVALLARLDPWLMLPSALLFGALDAGGAAMQRDAGVPDVLVKVVEATLIITALVAAAIQERRKPKSAP